MRTRPGAPTTSRDLIRLTAAAVCVVDFFVDDRSVDDVGAGLFCVSGLARPAGVLPSPFTRSSLLQKGLTLWTCIIAIFWKRFANLAFAQLRWEERLRASTGWLAALYRFLQPIQVNYTALLSVVFLFFCVICRPTLDHNCPSVWAMIATVRDERCDRIGEGPSHEQHDND